MKHLSLIILIFLSMSTSFAQDGGDDYTRVLKGTCDVKDKDLIANFYIRNTDKHFSFDYIDADGNHFEDNSVKHRQTIYTEEHGIKLRRGKVRMKSRMSFYKADFKFNVEKKTCPPGLTRSQQALITDAGSGTCSSISMQVTTSKVSLCSAAKASAVDCW